MAFDIKSTLQAIENQLLTSAYFAHVQVGEPKAPPPGPFAVSVFMQDVGVVSLTLSGTIERHSVLIRIYRRIFEDTESNIELEMAALVSRVMSDLAGEFDLGATIRNVDLGGQHGAPLSARFGYVDVGGTMYRVGDISVGLIVDDSGTQAP